MDERGGSKPNGEKEAEGFLCPLCFKSFLDQALLMEHFACCREKVEQKNENVDEQENCAKCDARFSSLRWKHECCSCGKTVCADCSPHRWHKRCIPPHKNVHRKEMVRICSGCHTVANKIHDFVRKGHLPSARAYFRANCAVIHLEHASPFAGATPHEDQLTLLHVAARSRNLAILKWLVEEHDHSVEARAGNDKTPIEIAAEHGNFENALYLYERGAKIANMRSVKNMRALLRVALDKLLFTDTKSIKDRLSKRVPRPESSVPTERKDSVACGLCSKAFSSLFNRKHFCSLCKIATCTACSPTRWRKECLPNELAKDGKTTVRICRECHAWTGKLHSHIASGHTANAKVMLRTKGNRPCYLKCCSAFIGDRPDTQLFTPLHGAAASGSVELLRWMIEGLDCDVNARCAQRSTPLETAASCGHLDSVLYLFGKIGSVDAIRSERTLRRTLDAAFCRLQGVTSSSSPRSHSRRPPSQDEIDVDVRTTDDTNHHSPPPLPSVTPRQMKKKSGKDMFNFAMDVIASEPPHKKTSKSHVRTSTKRLRSKRIVAHDKAYKDASVPPGLPPPVERTDATNAGSDVKTFSGISGNVTEEPSRSRDGTSEHDSPKPPRLRTLSSLFLDVVPDEPSPRISGATGG